MPDESFSSLVASFVTMFTTPVNADVPNTLAAGPSITSMRSMSSGEKGKSADRWPVCGDDMFTPFIRRVTWSNVPPLTAISVCTPISPRCLTSMPTAYSKRSLILCTAAVAMSAACSTVTIRAAWLSMRGTRVPTTSTSPSAMHNESAISSPCPDNGSAIA